MKRFLLLVTFFSGLQWQISVAQGSHRLPVLRKRLTAFVFLSPECPLCRNYTVTLNKLSNEFEKDLAIVGVIPGKTYRRKIIQDFKTEYHIAYPLQRDAKKKLSALWNATTTPEVVLVDAQYQVIYRGAIDDWAISPGRKKLSPQNMYLRNAVIQTLAGGEIAIRSTKAVGCLINDY